jgi:hypothetical protein
MKKALIESEKNKKKSLHDFYINLENEEGLENLQKDFNIVYKNLEIERSKLFDSRESLLSTLSPEDWDKIFSEL